MMRYCREPGLRLPSGPRPRRLSAGADGTPPLCFSATDVQQEKTHQNLLTGVEHFDKDSMKNVTPEEKTHLPSPEGRSVGPGSAPGRAAACAASLLSLLVVPSAVGRHIWSLDRPHNRSPSFRTDDSEL